MADRYWVGGTGNWNDTAHWSTASGGASGASVPTSVDDVYFDVLSSAVGYTATVNVASVCRSLTMAAPLTGNLTFAGTAALDIYGSRTAYAGLVRTHSGTTTFRATTTGHTITSAGTTLAATVFDGAGGGWSLVDAASFGSFTLTRGSFDTANQSVASGTMASSNTNTRSLTLGSSTWTCGGGWNLATTTGLTFSAGTSTIIMTGTQVFDGGGQTYYEGRFNSTSHTILGSNAYTTLSRTGTAVTFCRLELGDHQTITGTLTLTGDSASNRLYVGSTVPGTSHTLTAATVVASNVDLEDVTGAGAGSWDLSAIVGLSGDCGGNSGITFTAPLTLYWFENTGLWTDAGKWFTATAGGGSPGRMPLPQDPARFDGSSFSLAAQTVTIAAGTGRRTSDIDWTGVTNTPQFATTGHTSLDIYGSLALVAGMTLDSGGSWRLRRRGAQTLTSAGKTIDKTLTMIAAGGTYTLQDALTLGATRTLNGSTLGAGTGGTFDANGFDVSVGFFVASSDNTWNMGGGDWFVTGSAGTVWTSTNAGGLTINAEGSVIYSTYAGAVGTRTIGQSKVGIALEMLITAGTDTVSLSGIWRTLDYTGFAGTMAGVSSIQMTDANDDFGGELTLSSGLTRTWTGSLSFTALTGTIDITSAGKAFASAMSLGTALPSKVRILDNFSNDGTLTQQAGTVDLNDFNMTLVAYTSSGGSGKVLDLGLGTLQLTGTGGVFTAVVALTISPGTSTVKLTDTSGATKVFAGGSKTYANLWFAGGGGGPLEVTGSNDFACFDADPDTEIRFTAGTTTTIEDWLASGSAGNPIVVTSITAAPHSLVASGIGTQGGDYLDVSWSSATLPNTWYAGRNGVDSGNNAGWTFADPPLPTTFLAA